MATASEILELARAEIGVKESPPNSNHVKYNDVYGEGNHAWCAVFVWWLFRQAGAPELYYGGGKTAYCPTLMSYHKRQAVSGDYQPGDVIFFDFDANGVPNHVGLCESWDGTYIITIDGNTSAANPANGGMVGRMRRHKKYIVGAYRPNYAKGEIDLTEKQVREIVRDECKKLAAQRAEKPASDWAEQYIKQAVDNGLLSKNKGGGIDRPRDYPTREELATVAVNVLNAIR